MQVAEKFLRAHRTNDSKYNFVRLSGEVQFTKEVSLGCVFTKAVSRKRGFII